MATNILRKASKCCFSSGYRLFHSYSRSPKSSSCFSPFQLHGGSPIAYLPKATKLPLVNPLGCANHTLMWSFRYLATSSSPPQDPVNEKPEVPVKEKPMDDGSTEGEKAKGSDDTGATGKPVRGGPVSWLSFVLLVLTGAGLIFYYDKEKKRHIEEIKTSTAAVKQGPSVGKAAIGGPFNLVNQDGKPVTDKDFHGKWTLIYFGFTHCPDICPDELQKMVLAIDKIKQKAGIDIIPVFISVDPERDTVEQVREYVKEFHPDLVGLTGNTDDIRQVARSYRVYYMKTEEEGSDYLVDHSIVMYLMDQEMEFVKFFGKNYDADSLSEGIIKEVKQYKK
ncbi:protein SCO1 homolog 1, mitochondrial [Amborella trichopoda]|uniref:Thioredoxin domain-containing protein n=1 Tax=Amborella trichopoda TaxID=13333 RepID=U5DAW4_AMBTC|nr:protein SCO1 homolog 1, mitochondrial [Amborella trichopoda]ERN19380.1 hypothetical protein AMTR_s00069p00138950 [Amborella trichopoda]|eukprot:XP_006857913.1 protein SCO1 homolog 1, mitochondrial [Amborella trichopoda]